MPDKRQIIPAAIQRLAQLIKSDKTASKLSEILGPEKILVPIPGSSPLRDKDSLWVAKRICDELVKAKLANDTVPLLVRISPVQKASSAKRVGKPRPTFTEHFASLRCKGSFAFGQDITLVDDFVTSGTQLISAASLFKTMYPKLAVKAFALVRTISAGEVDQIISPYVAKIDYSPGSDYSNRS